MLGAVCVPQPWVGSPQHYCFLGIRDAALCGVAPQDSALHFSFSMGSFYLWWPWPCTLRSSSLASLCYLCGPISLCL